MQDRVSANPGRALITPEDGSAPFYATITRADNPEVEGTKINKNSLLKDATAALFGLGTDAVPDEVFALIRTVIDENYTAVSDALAAKTKISTGSYVGTNNYGSDNLNSITFNEAVKVVILFGTSNPGNRAPVTVIPMLALTTSYQGFRTTWYTENANLQLKKSSDGKTLYWYNGSSSQYQYNGYNSTYYYAALY